MSPFYTFHNDVAARWPATAGLTLIELLISILLGTMLSLTVSTVYLESVRNFMLENEMARLQENGRFSLNLLRRELSQAGFFAGIRVLDRLPPKDISSDCSNIGDWALDMKTPLDLVNNASRTITPTLVTSAGALLDCLDSNDVVSGSDVFAIKRTAGSHTLKNGLYQGGTKAKPGQWYLRVDNKLDGQLWVNQRSSGFPTADATANSGVDYWAYFARIFYLRNYSHTKTDGIPTLCVEALSGGASLGAMRSQCYIEGVEDMQIEFGVDTDFDGSADIFTDAPLERELANLVVARIYLLMRSIVEVPGLAKERTYVLGGKKVSRKDRFVRRIVSSTVALPNIRLAMTWG